MGKTGLFDSEPGVSQLAGKPGHLRAISGGFLGDNHVDGRRVAEYAGKPALDPVGATEHLRTQVGVSLIQPGGQADASRDRIQLGYTHAVLGQEQVGTDDTR